MQTESRLTVTNSGRVGRGRFWWNGYKVPVLESEKVLRVDDGEGRCATMSMHLRPQKYALQNC